METPIWKNETEELAHFKNENVSLKLMLIASVLEDKEEQRKLVMEAMTKALTCQCSVCVESLKKSQETQKPVKIYLVKKGLNGEILQVEPELCDCLVCKHNQEKEEKASQEEEKVMNTLNFTKE